MMHRVAVTGLGVVSPVGNTVDAFWSSLLCGRCGIGPITRYDASGSAVSVAAEVKGFDPAVYFDVGELRRTDLFVQYGVAAADQAIKDSKISGRVAPQRLGVYFGSGIGGASSTLQGARTLLERGAERVSPYFIPLVISNMAAGAIAIRYGAKGPCLPVVTACATSSHAIGEAYRAIRHGYADAILAGGAEAGISPLIMAGFINCNALSVQSDPACASLPFDRRRDGFVMGEGAGALLLEEWDHARARGARIYAEMTGYGNTCDAYHMTAPLPGAEESARAIAMAMEDGGSVAYDQIYFNAHGTGTPINDRVETLALKRVFGQDAYRIHISSTKSMTGHMMGAAGAAEAIASVLSLYHGVMPPTAGLAQADPECDLDYLPQEARKGEIRLALSQSLGFGGHNACLAFRPGEE